MEIRKIILCVLCVLGGLTLQAQDVKQVLDRTAKVVANKSGVSAAFTINNSSFKASGTIFIKGRMFHARTPQATIWFDGKTQWTYLKKNDEVNVITPTENEIAVINPYNFIYLYKSGYSATMTRKNDTFEVHLKAQEKKAISELYIVVDQRTYVPSQIRVKQQKGWDTIDIRHFKKTNLSDNIFRFNSKDYPSAEVVDLR